MRCLLLNSATTSGVKLVGRVAVIAALLALVALPSMAQSGQSNTNTATAVLHLRATVVPVAYSVLPALPQTSGTVSYHMPVPRTFVEVTQQVREMTAKDLSPESSLTGVLKTTVVLAQ